MKLMLCVFILCIPTFANAYHFCRGNIKTVWIDVNGRVNIVGTWRNGHTQICDMNSEWNGLDPEVCKVWLSSVQLAYAAKSDVTVRYDVDDIESCSTIPTYTTSPKPNYVMLTEHVDS